MTRPRLSRVGCAKQVSGTAQPDPAQPPLTVSKDGFGIAAGFDNAPIRIEIFTEPQCTPLRRPAEGFRRSAGLLHPHRRTEGHVPAADVPGQESRRPLGTCEQCDVPRRAKGMRRDAELQHFVEELWGHQDPGGPGPSNDEMAEMAKKAGMPEQGRRAHRRRRICGRHQGHGRQQFRVPVRDRSVGHRHTNGLRPQVGREAGHLRQRLAEQAHADPDGLGAVAASLQ